MYSAFQTFVGNRECQTVSACMMAGVARPPRDLNRAEVVGLILVGVLVEPDDLLVRA